MNRLSKKNQRQILRVAAHIGSLIPLVLILWDFNQGNLTADPIREVTLRTGKTAINLLVLSLAITPFNIWLGWKQLHPLRRIFGVYAFVYVGLHLMIFIWLDYGLSWPLIQEAIFEKWYALVGFAAFLILLPLTVTSTRWAMRKMGKKWTSLHKWVYLAGILAVLHYLLLVKNAYTLPVIYATILGLLLLTRVKPVKARILSWRRRLERKNVRRPEREESQISHT